MRRILFLQPFLLLAIQAHASTGTGMPWDQPMLIVSNSITGVMAHTLVTIAIAFAGIAGAFSHHGTGFRMFCSAIVCGAMAIEAATILNVLGWGGALS